MHSWPTSMRSNSAARSAGSSLKDAIAAGSVRAPGLPRKPIQKNGCSKRVFAPDYSCLLSPASSRCAGVDGLESGDGGGGGRSDSVRRRAASRRDRSSGGDPPLPPADLARVPRCVMGSTVPASSAVSTSCWCHSFRSSSSERKPCFGTRPSFAMMYEKVTSTQTRAHPPSHDHHRRAARRGGARRGARSHRARGAAPRVMRPLYLFRPPTHGPSRTDRGRVARRPSGGFLCGRTLSAS